MNAQTVGYKAKAFEPGNLLLFFLIALGLNWLRQLLLFFGIMKQPSGPTDPVILVAILATWGPTLAAFLLVATTEGRLGLAAFWGRFWNRSLSAKWLIVTLLFIPALWLIANVVSLATGGQDYRLFDQPSMFIGAFGAALGTALGLAVGLILDRRPRV